MRLAVVTNSAPFIRGGAELLVDRLHLELRRAGHEVEVVRLPLAWHPPERVLDSLLAASHLRVQGADRVIALKFPAFQVPHDDMVCWVIHPFRQVYDLWEHPTGWARSPDTERVRELVLQADRLAFERASALHAISSVVARRLYEGIGVTADVLLTPPHSEVQFRSGPVGDYILALGRIGSGKRQYLAAEAMRGTPRGLHLVIAGPPDSDAELAHLVREVEESGAGHRIRLDPRYISDEEKVALLSEAAAVFYAPVNEDSYGYVAYEAAMASRPIVTCDDSGGVLDLVEDRRSGRIVSPDPAAIAEAFRDIQRDRHRTREWGRRSLQLAEALDLSWSRVVEVLTG